VLVEDDGDEVTNLKDIAYHYLTGMFIIDLCATIPIDQILEAAIDSANPLYELFGILKFGRILRLNKIIQFLNVTEDAKASLKLFKIIFFLTIYLHGYACVWWLIVKKDQTWIPYMYTVYEDKYAIYQYSLTSQYTLAFHTSIQALLGGDIGPVDFI